MPGQELLLYWGVVLGVSTVVLLLLSRYIKRVNNHRTRALSRRKISAPIYTESPVSHPLDDFKEEGIGNINLRFSIINRSLLVLVVLVIIVLLLLPLAGTIPTTVISVFAASFAVVLGILSRPFIENYISGILISFNRPFQIGDTVTINDSYGTIEDITMTSTVVKQWDWRRYVIPNAKMLNTEFINHTRSDNFIWAKVSFYVAHHAPMEKVKEMAKKIARESPYFRSVEEPSFWVMDMDRNACQCWIAAWADSPSKAWELQSNIRYELMQALQREGIAAQSQKVQLSR